MDKNLFETIDPIVNEIADQLTTLIEGDTLSELKQKLADLSRELGVYSVTLEMNLQLCNPDDGQTLPLVQTGLASSDGAMPYQMWLDITGVEVSEDIDGKLAEMENEGKTAIMVR